MRTFHSRMHRPVCTAIEITAFLLKIFSSVRLQFYDPGGIKDMLLFYL